MDGIHVSDLGRADDAIGAQVAIGAPRAANADGFIGQLDVQGLHIGFRVYREGFDTQFAAGANHAEGYFTAISDENLLNHG